jgi:1-acyl-sn-glycerol-3-phosphate acyltransferase
MNRLEDIIATVGGAIKAITFLLMVALMIPVTVIYKRLDPHHIFRIPQLFHGLVLRLLGIRVRVLGTPSTASPVLFAANHASYLDIIVLGATLPAAFVAKSEVAGWPLFGYMAKLQNTIFIERRSTKAVDQRTQLQEHFVKRQNLILFPEGTSSDGMRALHFKSSLFSIVEDSTSDAPITVQPVSVTCTELDGYPMLREERPLYAWYGDMTLPPHLWNVFKRGHFTVDIIFHPPLTPIECANRKVLAATCQNLVAQGIETSLSKGFSAPQRKLASP